jgi:hypothetical protein
MTRSMSQFFPFSFDDWSNFSFFLLFFYRDQQVYEFLLFFNIVHLHVCFFQRNPPRTRGSGRSVSFTSTPVQSKYVFCCIYSSVFINLLPEAPHALRIQSLLYLRMTNFLSPGLYCLVCYVIFIDSKFNSPVLDTPAKKRVGSALKSASKSLVKQVLETPTKKTPVQKSMLK